MHILLLHKRTIVSNDNRVLWIFVRLEIMSEDVRGTAVGIACAPLRIITTTSAAKAYRIISIVLTPPAANMGEGASESVIVLADWEEGSSGPAIVIS